MPADLAELAKPLLAELKAREDAAADPAAKAKAKDAFFDDLDTAAHDIYIAIHQTGFNAGRGKSDEVKTKADVRVKAIEKERDELREQLEAAQATKPDVVALEEKYKGKLTKAEQALDTLKTEHAKESRTRALRDVRGEIESALVQSGFRAKAAKAEVLRLVDEGKIRLSDDGAVEIVKLDDPESVYPAPRGAAKAHDSLVRELLKSADPLDLESRVDNGGGVGRRGAGIPANPNMFNGADVGELPAGLTQEIIAKKLASRGGAVV